MLKPDQRIARLCHRLDELVLWTTVRAETLSGWRFNGAPLEIGAAWPTRDGVVRLEHGPVEVPQDWSLEHTRLELDLGGEGLIRLAYASGSHDAFGLDPNHRRFVLRERSFSISAECVARLPFGVPNRDARLARARLIETDHDLEEFVLLLRQVAETAHELGAHDAVVPLLAAAEGALTRLHWPSATPDYIARVAPGTEMQKVWELPLDLDPAPAALDETARASVEDARTALVESLRRLKAIYPQQGSLAVTGHAHIDLAWLWPLQETRRKANRTFHTMVGLMERYPDFRFNQSTAQLYAFLEEDDPELFARIAAKVKAGQWETIGGMWVEPDTNMPTGESLVRQILYGQRYFQRHFDRRHTVCWLPDCFGFSPALPQLLKLAGIEHFFTIKVNWSETNKFPHDLFWWEGLDGSKVLAHTFDNPVGGYNAETSPRAAMETWRNFRGKHRLGESLFSFGFGDGGGGPTEEMLERQRQMADFPVLPALRPVMVEDWFQKAHQAAAQDATTPVWVGEIYLELHRGTLSTQGRTKYLHRRAERALIAAEVLGCMAHLAGGARPASLEDHWRVLLRNEFHDILPGSSIREVHELAEAELGSVVKAGVQQSERHLEALSHELVQPGTQAGLLVVNPDCSSRPLRLESREPLPGGQGVESGSVICGAQVVPGLAAAVVLAVDPPPGLSVSPRTIENDFVRAQLAPDGTLASVFDKRAGREVLEGRGNQIWAYADKPRNWDAWDIEEDYWRQGEEITVSEPPEVLEHGPHRAAIRVVRDYRSSRITQTIRLWASSARLEFKTEIDWHDRRLLLKARFPLAIRNDFATFECAHGVVRRSTLRNTSWDEAQFEVAGHRFADLSEYGYGVALLNDGKYGHHAIGNELGLTLLRSPVFPDPLADEGRQSFTYALLPHQGDWLSGGVLAEAEDLNQPLLHRFVSAGSESEWQAVSLEGLQLGLSALKPTEDGEGLLLRLYEPAGARGRAEIGLPGGWELQSAVDLLEQPSGAAESDFRPFQLRGWTIKRT